MLKLIITYTGGGEARQGQGQRPCRIDRALSTPELSGLCYLKNMLIGK